MTDRAARLLDKAKALHLSLVTVESCTGGMVAGMLTAIPGASAVFERGWVTYSNAAKHQELGVSWADLDTFGAVSEQVAIAMAEGALAHSPADLAVSVTGIAGPDGGSAEKPVGLVYFACARRGHLTVHRRHIFSGNRDSIRAQAAETALDLLDERLF